MIGGAARGRAMLSSIGASMPPSKPPPPPPPTSAATPVASSSVTESACSTAATASSSAPARAVPSRSLPESCQNVLDAFIAIESTLPLLRKRDVPPLYGMLRKPVEEATRREFPPELLAALVHACPAAFRISTCEVSLTEERLRLTAFPNQRYDWLIEPTFPPNVAPPPPKPSPAAPDPQAKLEVKAEVAPAAAAEPEAKAVAAGPAGGVLPSRRMQVAEWRQARRAELVAALEAHARGHVDKPLPRASLPQLEPPKPKPLGQAKVEAKAEEPPLAAVPATAKGASGARAAAEAQATAAVPVGCAGLSAELLRKVQQRQAEMGVLVESQPKLERAALLKRLPEMAVAMRECMHESRRRLMPQAEVIRRLTQNAKWLTSTVELEAQTQLLAELVPQWVSLVRLGDDDELMVKVDEAVSFGHVQKALKAARSVPA